MLTVLLLLQDSDIPALIERLSSLSFAERQEAVEALVRRGRQALPALEEAAGSGDPEVKIRALGALDRIGEPRLLHRRAGLRSAALDRGGGNQETEASLLAALRWLARHQAIDGAWKEPACCGIAPATSAVDTGLTGLALLAFLGAGHTPESAEAHDGLRFGEVVEKGLQALLRRQEVDGCFGPRQEKFIYGHLIAALALAEAGALTEADALKAAAQKAVDFTVQAQNPGRGWRYQPHGGDNDTSVTYWAALQLAVARRTGLDVPPTSFEGARVWLKEATGDGYYRVGYTHRDGHGVRMAVPEEHDPHETLTAAGVFLRLLMGEARNEPPVRGGVDLLWRDLPSAQKAAVDYYYWHMGTQAVFHQSGPAGQNWKLWNAALLNALPPLQKAPAAGCTAGSWDPIDRWTSQAGRVCATALNALTLETYYRYRLPR